MFYSGVFYCPRIFLTHKFRCLFSLILLFFILVLLHLQRSYQTDLPRISSNLIYQQKILVPVSIKDLYGYKVVCSDRNKNNFIQQLINKCQIDFQGHFNLTLHPPEDFQIDSLATNRYLQQWQTIDSSCSILNNETIAIVIPYRDRKENLRNLLFNLIQLLQRQKITNYQIFIVEQQTTGAFNKGRLLNIAFEYLRKTYRPTCVIFHDADLIPENDRNFYSCMEMTDRPVHMSANIHYHLNETYTTIYPFLVGGVLKIRPETFVLLNGYSNEYFNWGGEDDDMGLRFLAKDLCVHRSEHGYYYAHTHSRQIRNINRFRLLFDAVLRQDIDGLTNIDQLAIITHVDQYPLISWLSVQWKN